MAGRTQLSSREIGSVQRNDFDTSTTGQAIITKVIAGTNVTISNTGVDAGTGDVTINATGTVYTSSNGVTKTGNDFALGGTLLGTTTIDTAAYGLTVSTATAGAGPLTVTSTTGNALTVNATTAAGIYVTVTGTSPAFYGLANTASTNSLTDVLTLIHKTTGTAAVGLGNRVSFYGQTSGGGNSVQAYINSEWTNATTGAQAATLSFLTGTGGATPTASFTINGDGTLVANKYTSSVAGTAVYSLNVDSTGKIITGSVGGGGANSLGTYVVQTATNAPANAQILASLGTGIVKNTTTTGVLSIAIAADFPTLNQSTTGTASNITGILNAASHPALTGDVTTPSGSVATTIANNVVTFAKMAQVATGVLLGRTTASTGNVETITIGSGLSMSAGVLSSTYATPTLEQTIIAGSTLTAARTINTAGFTLTVGTGTALPFALERQSTGNANTVIPVLQLTRGCTGFAANFSGSSIEFWNEDDNGVNQFANSVRSVWADISSGTRRSNFEIYGLNNATAGRVLSLDGSGALVLDGYNVAVITGSSAVYDLSVDSNGAVRTKPTINIATGAANTLAYYASASTSITTLTAITANRALISNASGLPIASATTNTELGYVSGVTSAIQTQLNAKSNSLSTYIVQTATNAPTNAQILAALGTGIVKNTTTTGVLSIATAGTDYSTPSSTDTFTNKNLTSGTNTFPTFNQNTTGTASNITGVLNATSFPALTGDVTTTSGSVATTIANNVVTLAKMATIATNTLLGRSTAATGNVEVITVGSGLTLSAGTLTASGGGGSAMSFTDVTTTTQTMVAGNGYTANNAGLVTFTLPATAAYGTEMVVAGKGAGGWRISQLASQILHVTNLDTTTGTGGYIASTATRDTVRLLCVVANLEWDVIPEIGNITVV